MSTVARNRLALAVIAVLVASTVAPAHAQQIGPETEPTQTAAPGEPATTLETVSVLGSRTKPRTEATSAVPIDILGGEEFHALPSVDVLDKLRVLVPSFNVSTIPIDDAATLVRPANLRGLPPDNTLVLVNGKRRHRAAVITFLGHGLSDGSQGPDISVFPSLALEQVEVLRDGAAAQYGSDAIAGVASAQEQESATTTSESSDATTLETVSVLGSRTKPRTEASSAVPIDILGGEEF
nr:TonB-dependent receptor plug domain-containing protein [Lysobacter sp.]